MFGLLEVFGNHAYITIFGVLLTTLYIYLKYMYSHFDRLGIEYLKPTWGFGNMGDMILGRENFVQTNLKFYHAIQGRFGGTFLFFRPMLMVKDPELANQMLIKDFDYFTDRGLYTNEKDDPLTAHLLAVTGDKWRTMRTRLSPTFTSGKLKLYSKTILDIADRFQNYIADTGKRNNVFEVRDLVARFTTDIITSVAFGVDVDSVNNPKEIFREIGEIIVSPRKGRILRTLFAISFPQLMKFFKLKLTDPQVEEFIRNVTEQTLQMREKGKFVRHDFMQLLILLRNGAKVTDDGKWEVKEVPENEKFLTVNEMMAQVFVFFLAGFETTSSAVSLALFEIAKQPAIQQKLHTEVDEVLKRHDGKLTYDSVKEMKYLGQCFDEILRIFPSVPILIRVSGRDYKIPGTDKILPKGSSVVINAYAMQTDPKYYKNPSLYDPDRFAPENRAKFHPHTYLPFGDGPRNCIGMRLGLLQAQVTLASIFMKFSVELAPGQARELKFDPRGSFNAIGGINLAIKPRK